MVFVIIKSGAARPKVAKLQAVSRECCPRGDYGTVNLVG
jgi:hypothetical protein